MRTGPWSYNDIIIAQELAKTGLSARDIGNRIGRSRNAVAGKLYRMGYRRLAFMEHDAKNRNGKPKDGYRKMNDTWYFDPTAKVAEKPLIPKPVEIKRTKRTLATPIRVKRHAKLCETQNCRGTRQPGLKLCAECNRKRLDARVSRTSDGARVVGSRPMIDVDGRM